MYYYAGSPGKAPSAAQEGDDLVELDSDMEDEEIRESLYEGISATVITNPEVQTCVVKGDIVYIVTAVDIDDHAFKLDNKRLFLIRKNDIGDSIFDEVKNESSKSLNVDRPFLERRPAFRTAKKKRKRRESFGLRRMLTKSKVTPELSPFQPQ